MPSEKSEAINCPELQEEKDPTPQFAQHCTVSCRYVRALYRVRTHACTSSGRQGVRQTLKMPAILDELETQNLKSQTLRHEP